MSILSKLVKKIKKDKPLNRKARKVFRRSIRKVIQKGLIK